MAENLVRGGAGLLGSRVFDLFTSQAYEEEIVNYHRAVGRAV
jgi:hypothetical protein